MSKNHKGMVCLLSAAELRELRANSIAPDCRLHRHLSRRRVCQLFGDARFADRILAYVYFAQKEFLGFIVESGGIVRWCEKSDDERDKVWIDPISRAAIASHVNRIQASIPKNDQQFPILIEIPPQRSRPGVPSRRSVLSETLRSHSPCSITAKESELNAEGAVKNRRIRGDRNHRIR